MRHLHYMIGVNLWVEERGNDHECKLGMLRTAATQGQAMRHAEDVHSREERGGKPEMV